VQPGQKEKEKQQSQSTGQGWAVGSLVRFCGVEKDCVREIARVVKFYQSVTGKLRERRRRKERVHRLLQKWE
jgi:hypothetical protein